MKDIIGYEGLYAITSCGKVWSYRSQKFLKPSMSKDGYLRAGLHKDGKLRTIEIHRLVAEAYIPNPEGKPQVNHIDEIKTHNYINNLEWVSAKENVNHGTRTQRASETRKRNNIKLERSGKKVYCVELDKVFNSQRAAADELGLDQGSISKCCNGKLKTCGKLHFKFYQGEEE